MPNPTRPTSTQPDDGRAAMSTRVSARQALALLARDIAGPQLARMSVPPVPIHPITPITPITPIAPIAPIHPVTPISPPAPPTPPTPPTPPPPVQPGALGTAITANPQQLQALVIAALGTQFVAIDDPAPPEVIWQDHDSEVLVYLAKTAVRMQPGLVLVGLAMQTDQTGAGQVVVGLGIGNPKQPSGLIVATEAKPRGPVALVDRWGDAAVAAAWRSLLDAAHALALQAGVDTFGARLVPAALSTDGQTLAVVPQARHAVDAVIAR